MKEPRMDIEGIRIFPRGLARGMAKAEIGSSSLSGHPWRLAAATRAGKYARRQKGDKHAERSE